MENIEIALLLMVVGMSTVFAILLIVIYLGKGLIILVNRYAPEELPAKKKNLSPAVQAEKTPRQTLSNGEAAAIVSAVSVITHGQGKVIRIEKL